MELDLKKSGFTPFGIEKAGRTSRAEFDPPLP
jgi:hypothetical protein